MIKLGGYLNSLNLYDSVLNYTSGYMWSEFIKYTRLPFYCKHRGNPYDNTFWGALISVRRTIKDRASHD